MQIGKLANCYDWTFITGARGLVVTGRIYDIGQKVLQSSFQTEISTVPINSAFSSLSLSSKRSYWKYNK